jgi:hypothetical protein
MRVPTDFGNRSIVWTASDFIQSITHRIRRIWLHLTFFIRGAKGSFGWARLWPIEQFSRRLGKSLALSDETSSNQSLTCESADLAHVFKLKVIASYELLQTFCLRCWHGQFVEQKPIHRAKGIIACSIFLDDISLDQKAAFAICL